MLQYVPSTVEHIRTELRKVIVGQDEVVEQVLVALLAEGHALIEGVPGTAKTLLVKTLARIVGADFSRIQFTPDLMPSDITGTNVFNTATASFSLRRGPVFTDVLLADEINRTPPKTQSALLEAMEERQVTIDGEQHRLSPLFTVFATENPIEYEGTYPLPEAQLDRFLLKIIVDYPTEEEERAGRRQLGRGLQRAPARTGRRAAARRARRRHALPRRSARRAHGAGRAALPRGTRAAHARAPVGRIRREPARERRAAALREGARGDARARLRHARRRARRCAAPSLRHRLSLRAEAELDGATTDAVITDILNTVEVPR